MNELRNQLAQEFEDAEYAHAYLEENGNMRIAAQVRALRNAKGWTQADLAVAAGMRQERISKIEMADFDSLTLRTLRRLAQAFDVNLHVAFNSVHDAVSDFVTLSPARLVCEPRVDSLAKIAMSAVHGYVGAPTIMTSSTLAAGSSLSIPATSSPKFVGLKIEA